MADISIPNDLLQVAAERANQEQRSVTDVIAALMRDYARGRTWLNLPDGRRSTDPLYSQESLDAAAAEIARQMHGGPADPDDIKTASEVLTAAFTVAVRPQVTE